MSETVRDLRDQRILELREQGLSLRAVAAEVGMTKSGVASILRRLSGDPRYEAELDQRRARGYRRSPEVLCKGCGRPCWKTEEVRKRGQHRVLCVDCRRAANTVNCAFCRKPFVRRSAENVYCSMECTQAGQALARDAERVRVNCSGCGISFPIRPFKLRMYKRFFCSRECQHPNATFKPRLNRQVNSGDHVRRAIAYEVPYARGIDPIEVFNADKWRCGICWKNVDQTLVWPDPMRASLDHIIPLSVVGSPGHVRSNVQCSHLRCNIRKNNRVTEQPVRMPLAEPKGCRRGSPFCSGGAACPHKLPLLT